MTRITRTILTLTLIFACSCAIAQTLHGVTDSLTGVSAPLTPCNSTGIYDLSNTCNDIYFIGALK